MTKKVPLLLFLFLLDEFVERTGQLDPKGLEFDILFLPELF